MDSPLHADIDAWTPVPDPLTYQWNRNGLPIEGATDDSYTPSQEDIRSYITVSVTGWTTGYYSKVTSLTGVVVTARLFRLPSTDILSGTGVVDSRLDTNIDTWMPAPETVTYQWYRGEEEIFGATDPNYFPSQDDIGEDVWVRITGKSPGYKDDTVDSTRRITITADGFAFAGTPVSIDGTAQVEHTLTASSTVSTSQPVTQHVAWLRNDAYTGVSGSTYVLSSSDIDSSIRAEVTFSKPGFQTQTLTTDAVTVDGYSTYDFETLPAVIYGTPKVGNTLTADTTLNPPPGVSKTIEWLVNGAVRATGGTLVLTSSDAGARVQVRYTFDALGYPLQSFTSGPVIVDYQFAGSPATISGTSQIEYTLTAVTTLVPGQGVVTETIEWLRDGPTVVGTGGTYTPTEGDIGHAITVRYTFSKPGRETLSYTSEAVYVAGYYDYSFGGVPSAILGTAKVEYTLTASSTITTPGVDTTITWYRDGYYRGSGNTLTLTESDIGSSITVRYMFDKQGYPLKEYYSLPVTVAGYSYFQFNGAAASISGTPRPGYTLTASTTITSGPSSTTIRWYVNGSYRSTGSTYVVAAGDIGYPIQARYTFDKQGYQATTYSSSSVTAYTYFTFGGAAASISGTLKVGYTLTAGTAIQQTGVTKTYQWYRGTTLVGTGSTYKPTLSGSHKVTITFSKFGYVTTASTSTAVTVTK